MINRSFTIAVAGIGYVGLSNAILLAQRNTVYAVDVLKEKINMVNNRLLDRIPVSRTHPTIN